MLTPTTRTAVPAEQLLHCPAEELPEGVDPTKKEVKIYPDENMAAIPGAYVPWNSDTASRLSSQCSKLLVIGMNHTGMQPVFTSRAFSVRIKAFQ